MAAGLLEFFTIGLSHWPGLGSDLQNVTVGCDGQGDAGQGDGGGAAAAAGAAVVVTAANTNSTLFDMRIIES